MKTFILLIACAIISVKTGKNTRYKFVGGYKQVAPTNKTHVTDGFVFTDTMMAVFDHHDDWFDPLNPPPPPEPEPEPVEEEKPEEEEDMYGRHHRYNPRYPHEEPIILKFENLPPEGESYGQLLAQELEVLYEDTYEDMRKRPRVMIDDAVANMPEDRRGQTMASLAVIKDQTILGMNRGTSYYIQLRFDKERLDEIYRSSQHYHTEYRNNTLGTDGLSPLGVMQSGNDIKNLDIIIMATNDYWDYVNTWDITKEFMDGFLLDENHVLTDPEEAAEELIQMANERLKEHYREPPRDDMTVIVAQIVKDDD